MSERDVRRLLALVERHIGASWADVSDWLRDQNSLDAIEARLLAYDFAGVVAEVEAAARRFAAETHSQYLRSGQAASTWLDGKLPDRLVRFDVVNERAVRAARRNELELVYGMSDEQRTVARQVIVDGQRQGLNPRSIARDLRDSIGLNAQQEKAVRSYRHALENGEWSNALGRELSSGQTDRTLRRVQRDGGALTEKQVDAAVERYRANQIAYRAETIARTESARNVHAGLAEAMQQAIDRGDVQAELLVKEWIHGASGNARPHHVAMDGVQVAFGEDFALPSGVRMKWPHDASAPASETANCRCTYATRLVAA